MRKFHLNFILFLSLSNFLFSQHKISIKEIKDKSECRVCFGKLIVSNGFETDTVFGGQWGNFPNYKLEKLKENQVLIIDQDYGFSGGKRIRSFKILSLQKHKFLSELFNKNITVYAEAHSAIGKLPLDVDFTENKEINSSLKKKLIAFNALKNNTMQIPTNFVYSNNIKIKFSENMNITNEIVFEKCPEIEGLECSVLTKFSITENFNIFK